VNDERRKEWTVRVLNWSDFQHYTGRNPPWIKLHRSLLDKPDWRRLGGAGGKLLVDLWMLAAGTKEGHVLLRLGDLGYRLRMPLPRLARVLIELASGAFVELSKPMLADCKQAHTNGVAEGEGDTETETTKSALRAVRS
jgi:hypothetical protein